MAYNQLFGCKFYVSSGLASAKTVSSVTNAAPPVVNSTAHGYSNGNEIVLFNNWDFLKSTVVQASSVAANSWAIAGYDSTDTNYYPTAGSAGTSQLVSGWLPMGQILGIDTQGGDANFEDLKPFDSLVGTKVFSGFAGASVTFTLGWDPADATQQSLQTTSRVAGKRAIKFALPGGKFVYGYGTTVANPMPKFESVMKQSVVVTFDGINTIF